MKTFWAATAAIILALCAGCTTPDKRIGTALSTAQQLSDSQARNTDRIWTSFVASYRAKELDTINGFYAADQKKAADQKPKRFAKNPDGTPVYPTTENYADDLTAWSGESATFLAKADVIRARNIGLLDAKIAAAQATYDATKKNQESFAKIIQLLQDYENAKIDPSAVAPIIQEIVTTFIPVDPTPTPAGRFKVIKPRIYDPAKR